MREQNFFSWNEYARTLRSCATVSFCQCTCGVWLFFSFSFFGIQMVDFLCSHSAIDFYHIGMQLRGGVLGKGKRKEEPTILTSQVLTCWQLIHYSGVNTVTARDTDKAKSPCFYWSVCMYTQSYISEPCVMPGSVCTCWKHQRSDRNRVRKTGERISRRR